MSLRAGTIGTWSPVPPAPVSRFPCPHHTSAKEAKGAQQAQQAQENQQAKQAQQDQRAKQVKQAQQAKQAKQVKQAEQAQHTKQANQAKKAMQAEQSKTHPHLGLRWGNSFSEVADPPAQQEKAWLSLFSEGIISQIGISGSARNADLGSDPL